MMLTYDFYDLAEASAVRALTGESAVRGHLPIALSTEFPVGHGLERRALAPGGQPSELVSPRAATLAADLRPPSRMA